MGLRIGVAHHLGWAVLVTASEDHDVVDRRRVELIGDDLPAAPVHHRSGVHEMHSSGVWLDDEELQALVARTRASARDLTTRALNDLVNDVGVRIESISLRDWPDDFPSDIAKQRTPPYESWADSVMYREIFDEQAAERGWAVHRFNGTTVEVEASAILGGRVREVLHGPRATLGAPWNKDHRMALAATVVAGATQAGRGRS